MTAQISASNRVAPEGHQSATQGPTDVLTVDPLPLLPVWKVGARYWCRNGSAQVVIVSTSLRGAQPIAGILLTNEANGEDEVYKWSANGLFNRDGITGVLDLMTERV